MISVGSGDERKRIGPRLQMEETGLEEGEALSYDNEAQDSTIEPDIALSYIEEKLQNVLGHFQKDFEGGVSAENLGAKFGGYGSFLPTYQRSPSWSHTKSPAEAHHNYDSPGSPKKLHVEDQRRNSYSSPLRARHVAIVKAASLGSCLKDNNSYLPPRYAEESCLRRGDVKKPANSSDQGTLKLRNKVGSENLSTQKNAEIYNGLGLVVSPSSSLDDCPTTSEGQFGKHTEEHEASPTSILQIMTIFPGELLLSPLSEDLFRLTEKKKPRGKFETKTVDKTSIESSGTLKNGSLFSKFNQKKSKLPKKGDIFSIELKNQENNDKMDNSDDSLLKKEEETEIDTLVCEELVSNSLKLTHLSGSQNNNSEPASLKDSDKLETLSTFTWTNDNESAQAIGGIENLTGKPSNLGKTSESERGNRVSNIAAGALVDQSESFFSKGRKSEESLKPAYAKSSTEGKKKQKVANIVGTEGASLSRNDSFDLQTDHENPRDRYKDFFGDVEFENEDNEPIAGEMKSPGMLKNPRVVGKRSPGDDHNISKMKFDLTISQKPPQVLKNYSGSASQSTPPSGLSSEALAISVPLVLERPTFSDSSDRGTNLKIKSKQEADMDGCRASKRMKSEELHGYWTSDNCGSSSKPVHIPTIFSNNASGNNNCKNNSQTDLSAAKKGVVSGMNAESHDPGSAFNGLLFSEKCDEKDSIRKRKAKEQRDGRKEKKARVSKSGGKDSNGSKTTVEIDSRSLNHKDDHNEQSPRNTQAADYLKSDASSVIPTVAANSSSFMVPSSPEGKNIGQEVKSSFVESVSSSPLRYPNADKITSNKNKEIEKDGWLSGENERGNTRKGEVLNVNNPVTDVHVDSYASVKKSSEQCNVEEKALNIDQSQKKKPGKGFSSHSKDKARASGSDSDKVQNSSRDSLHHAHVYEERPKSHRNERDEKSGTPSKSEKFIGEKENLGGTPSDTSKGKTQKKFGHDKKDIIRSQEKHNMHQEHTNVKLSKRSNHGEANANGKSHSLPPLAKNLAEPISGTQKENVMKNSALMLDNGEGQRAQNHRTKAEDSNGQPVRHSTPSSHKVRDIDAPSPLRRDLSSHAANSALKEAKDLKHLADRLKNNGSTESVGLYLQAALKFLHGASLLETGSSETTKHKDLMHSMHIYSSTAKLCEFCAHEYEKLKDMAAVSLAYKCMEVAYLRVVYLSHNSANRDRTELHTALEIVPSGESPSSSASDVDNLNHQTTTDKAALAKVVSLPQVSGSHTITSRNRSGFSRLLNFAQDVNFAMEASRKSRIAFRAATAKLGESSNKESLNSLKEALDFNFLDIEELLRLVRFAMEAINS